MKRVIILSLLLVVSLNISSCKSEKPTDKSEKRKVEVKKSKSKFSLENANNEINFVAYKTTDKVPVGGQFKKVDISQGGEGNSIKEAIHNAEFSIPVSSLFTQNASRDYKIKKFFFPNVLNVAKALSYHKNYSSLQSMQYYIFVPNF